MKQWCLWTLSLAVLLVCGCGQASSESESLAKGDPAGSPTLTRYLASEEPAGVMEIGDARKSAGTDEEVVIVGRIGGSGEPFVEGLAAFTLVDLKVPYCAADEGCPTPWDYCCTQDEVKDNIATIKLVDGEGKLVNEDARNLPGVKELSVVVAQGTALRDESGNLTVAATKIFVRPVK